MVYALASGTNRNRPVMNVIRMIVMLAAQLEFSYSSFWVSSDDNSIADSASRFQYFRMFSTTPHLRKKLAHLTPTHVVSNIPSPLTPSRLFLMAWPRIINLINIQDRPKILYGLHHHAPPIPQLGWIISTSVADSDTRMGWMARWDETAATQNH